MNIKWLKQGYSVIDGYLTTLEETIAMRPVGVVVPEMGKFTSVRQKSIIQVDHEIP